MLSGSVDKDKLIKCNPHNSNFIVELSYTQLVHMYVPIQILKVFVHSQNIWAKDNVTWNQVT